MGFTFSQVSFLSDMRRLEDWQVEQYILLIKKLKTDPSTTLGFNEMKLWLTNTPYRPSAIILWMMDEEAKVLVGTVQATLIPKSNPSVLLDEMVVADSHEGQGHAKTLFSRLLIEIKLKWPNVNSIDLTSSPRRVRANRLYQSLGFVHRTTNVYRFTLNEAGNG